MLNRIRLFELSRASLVIIIGAIVKFALHMYIAPGYGFFFDELYTIALSRHLAFGYVDLPTLVPALVALSRSLLGESLFAVHIVPALAGSFTLVFACLITEEFGGKTFSVMLTALGFIIVPIWLTVDSIFCYDSIDQLILATFLFYLIRFLRIGNKRLTNDRMDHSLGNRSQAPIVKGYPFFGTALYCYGRYLFISILSAAYVAANA